MVDRLRWGVIGTSRAARQLFLPAVAGVAQAEVVRIGGRDETKTRSMADEFGVAGAGSYDDVLASDEVDAVYISLANSLHLEWILKALDAGKPVLCEKPMVLDAAEAEEVLQRSERTGLPVMEGLMYRFHPQNVRVRELIAAGAIGEVAEVHVRNAFRLVDSMDPTNIRLTDGKGGGALMDMGCYVVSAARMLYGAEPIAVSGWIDHGDDSNGTTNTDWGVDVGFAGTLEFPGRRFAQVSWSFRTGYGAGYTVVGSAGSIEVPRAFIPGNDTLQLIRTDTAFRQTIEEIGPADHFQLMIGSFSAAVLADEPLRYDARDALANARALDLVRSVG